MTPQETAAKLRRTADAIEAEGDHFDPDRWDCYTWVEALYDLDTPPGIAVAELRQMAAEIEAGA